MELIRSVTARVVAVPLEKTIYTPIGQYSHRYATIATIETANGSGSHYGWTLYEREAAALRELILHAGVALLGQQASEINANRTRALGRLKLSGRTGLGLFAVGVLDACLWDLHGKSLGVPIWKLLGGTATKPIPCYASGLFMSATLDELRSEARAYAQSGFKWVKMRVGMPSLREDLERIDLVRTELGDDVNLMLDAVLSWDVGTALERIRAFEPYRPYWVEDPVDYHEGRDLSALAAVTRQSPVAICAGEFIFGPEAFRQAIVEKAIHILMVDMQHVGGLSPWLDICAMARHSGQLVVPHVFMELALHVHCIDQSPLPIEFLAWTSDLYSDAEPPVNGAFAPPHRPGIGFTYDQARIAKWTVGSVDSVSV